MGSGKQRLCPRISNHYNLSSTLTENSSVAVAAGGRQGDFALVASGTTGTGMVLAKDINGTRPLNTNSVTRVPVAGDLIITEVFRNPAGNQPEKVREWFEVYNPTSDTLVLDGLIIEDNGGATRIHGRFDSDRPGEYGIRYSANPNVNGGLTALGL